MGFPAGAWGGLLPLQVYGTAQPFSHWPVWGLALGAAVGAWLLMRPRPILCTLSAATLLGLLGSGAAFHSLDQLATRHGPLYPNPTPLKGLLLVPAPGPRGQIGVLHAGTQTIQVDVKSRLLGGCYQVTGWLQPLPHPALPSLHLYSPRLQALQKGGPVPLQITHTQPAPLRQCQALTRLDISSPGAWVQGGQRHLQERFQDIFRSRDIASLMGALVVGDRASPLAHPLKQAFRAAGLSHLTAASGYNLSVVVGSLLLVGWLLGLRLTVLLPVCGLGAVLYATLSGWPPSMIRATSVLGVAATVTLLCQWSGSQKPPLAVMIALGVAVVIAVNPLLLLDLGFQLSVLATWGLGFWMPPWWRLLATHQRVKWLGLWLPSLAAQVWVTPLLHNTFHNSHVWSLPLNILAGPLAALLTVGAWLLGLVGSVLPDEAWEATRPLWSMTATPFEGVATLLVGLAQVGEMMAERWPWPWQASLSMGQTVLLYGGLMASGILPLWLQQRGRAWTLSPKTLPWLGAALGVWGLGLWGLRLPTAPATPFTVWQPPATHQTPPVLLWQKTPHTPLKALGLLQGTPTLTERSRDLTTRLKTLGVTHTPIPDIALAAVSAAQPTSWPTWRVSPTHQHGPTDYLVLRPLHNANWALCWIRTPTQVQCWKTTPSLPTSLQPPFTPTP